MKIIHSVEEMQRVARQMEARELTVGLVPTMGALHDGHLSLIRQAAHECRRVIASIFVNPTQFGPAEDLDKYPRMWESDLDKCRQLGVAVVFAPRAESMYPSGFQTWVEPGPLAEVMCGASRPGHFRGVTTVCCKLFNVCRPARAYFGRKDFQQLRIIQQMVQDLNMPLEIVPMPIVREQDGLALSSRNRYLSEDERRAALVLRRALDAAQAAWNGGTREPAAIRQAAMDVLETEAMARVDYVTVADPESLREAEECLARLLVALAVFIGGTRLIDNDLLEE